MPLHQYSEAYHTAHPFKWLYQTLRLLGHCLQAQSSWTGKFVRCAMRISRNALVKYHDCCLAQAIELSTSFSSNVLFNNIGVGWVTDATSSHESALWSSCKLANTTAGHLLNFILWWSPIRCCVAVKALKARESLSSLRHDLMPVSI